MGVELVCRAHNSWFRRRKHPSSRREDLYEVCSDLTSQGLYGLAYVAPSPSRKRPYHLITSDPLELRKIQEAERNIQHLVIKNHQHRDTGWKLLRMRAEGSEFYCYDSLIVNGKASCVPSQRSRTPGWLTFRVMWQARVECIVDSLALRNSTVTI